MSTRSGFKISKNRKFMNEDDDGIDIASDASLYCIQEQTNPQPKHYHQQQHQQQQQYKPPIAPKPAPRLNNAPTPKPRSVLLPSSSATAATNMASSTSSSSSSSTASTAAVAAASMQHLPSGSTVAPASSMTTSSHSLYESLKIQQQMENITPRSKQRLIKCDLLLLQDDDNFFDDTLETTSANTQAAIGVCSQPKMPPYPIGGYLTSEPPAQTSTITKAQQLQQQQPHQQQPQQNRSSGGGVPAEPSNSLATRLLRRTSI